MSTQTEREPTYILLREAAMELEDLAEIIAEWKVEKERIGELVMRLRARADEEAS